MKIRPLAAGDLDQVARVQAAAMVASAWYRESVDVEAELARLAPRVAGYFRGSHHPSAARRERAGFVAEDQGTIVGFVAGHLSTRMGCEAELQWAFVLPGRQRRGIGAALLEPMARWFAAQGAHRVIVDAPPGNPAREFYLRHGAVALDGHWLHWPEIERALTEAGGGRRERVCSGRESTMNRRQRMRGLLLLAGALLIIVSGVYTLLHLRDEVILSVLLPGFASGLILIAVSRAMGRGVEDGDG